MPTGDPTVFPRRYGDDPYYVIMKKQNLISALYLATKALEKQEGPNFKSALRAGFEEIMVKMANKQVKTED